VTLDVITDYCYDSCLDCVEQPDFAPYVDCRVRGQLGLRGPYGDSHYPAIPLVMFEIY
jgi:hypothetical protein